jgi:molecular chaperone Hsp33
MSDNFIQSFQLEQSGIRGRIVRLGSVLEDILVPHAYPDDVMHLTGETLTLCTVLSSMLKYDGIFTLQVQGDGPVKMLVADMTSEGKVRACATFTDEDVAKASIQSNRGELLGKGYMAFTVDQGENTDRYQGIVELKNSSLLDSVQNYFAQSEQINTGIMMAVGKVEGHWRACGIMLQKMPEETALYNRDNDVSDEDDWRRAMVLLGSVKDEEMLSTTLEAPDLLYRLFHEEGVRVYDPVPLINECRCNMERVRVVLSGMNSEDLEHMTIDGKITMTCEFCSRDYAFDPADIQKGQ